jgi:hypothetical protein
MTLVLALCGFTVAAMATWRGYVNARDALMPLTTEGEPTRTAIDAGRPLLARARVRRFVRGAAMATGWLVVAMYGLFLLAAAEGPQ